MGDVTIVPVNTLDVYRELLSAPTVEVFVDLSVDLR